MKSTKALAAALVVLLSACASPGSPDPSAAPAPAQNFCDAMAVAATTAPPAVEALDGLFAIMDAMSTSASAGDIDTLNAAGTTTVSTATDYAAALDAAAALAPAGTAPDIQALSDYWTLYVMGLGQIAETAPSYASLIDQTGALQSSDAASSLIAEQPATQQRVNDSYIAECTNG